MAHRKQGYRFENDWEKEFLEEYIGIYQKAIAIPVNVEIEAEHRVLNMDVALDYLRRANPISVMDCGCRKKFANCDAPLNVCLNMNELASGRIERGEAMKITFDEAVDIMTRSHEAGLVHMAYKRSNVETDDVHSLCSCCSCCCGVLSSVLRYGLHPHLLTALKTSVTDTSGCTSCGDCAERCQFGAREMNNSSLVYNSDLCFGCGLCVSTCPNGVITLIAK